MDKKGFYWSPEKWEITLDEPKSPYIKIPTVTMLAIAPLMGALFVVFLPIVGFVMLGSHLVRKAIEPFAGWSNGKTTASDAVKSKFKS
jgi:hypothetical protein